VLDVIASYTWPNDGIPLARLGLGMDELASLLGVTVHTWTVDGLGPARGLGFRAASGRIFLLEELEFAVLHHGAVGPDVYADASDLAQFGPDPLVEEIVLALGIARSDVVLVAELSVQDAAAALVAQVAAARARRLAEGGRSAT